MPFVRAQFGNSPVLHAMQALPRLLSRIARNVLLWCRRSFFSLQFDVVNLSIAALQACRVKLSLARRLASFGADEFVVRIAALPALIVDRMLVMRMHWKPVQLGNLSVCHNTSILPSFHDDLGRSENDPLFYLSIARTNASS